MNKLNISKKLKYLNKEYRSNLNLEKLSELTGISKNSLCNMTTNSSFENLYNVCSAIFDFYYDNTVSYKYYHEYFSFMSLLNFLLEDETVYYN